MGVVSGSMSTVVLGVSQQPVENRKSGQMTEQVNMISDPVSGLVRRPGSVAVSAVALSNTDIDASSKPYAVTAPLLKTHKSIAFTNFDKPWVMAYNTKFAASTRKDCALFMIDPVNTGGIGTQGVFPLTGTETGYGLISPYLANGVESVLDIGPDQNGQNTLLVTFNNADGDYAGGSSTTAGTAPYWVNRDGQHVVWVKGGTYSRTFKVTTWIGGTSFTASYTTPAASYPGVLDTSTVASTDPQYTKKVADLTAAYNTAVTQWVGDAANKVSPDYIVSQLIAQLNAHYNGPNPNIKFEALPAQIGIYYDAGAGLIQVNDYTSPAHITGVTVSDGGDNSLIKASTNEVTDTSSLSPWHYNTSQSGGLYKKVVRVKPKRSDGTDALYMRAEVRADVTSAITGAKAIPVTWVECAGKEEVPVPAKLFAVQVNAFGTCSFFKPTFTARQAGDALSNPLPKFTDSTVGRITHMALFQNRLVLCSGNVISMSKTNDYFNFFRDSVLEINDDDPIEIEADVGGTGRIRHSVTFDRNLVLYADNAQFALSGRSAMTPANASIITQSFYRESVDAAPRALEQSVFHCTRHGSYSALSRTVPGVIVDSPDVNNVTVQTPNYLVGTPKEIVSTVSPSAVFVTTDATDDIYAYFFLGQNGQDLFTSWSKWNSPNAGTLVTLSQRNDQLIALYLRLVGSQMYLVADRFNVRPNVAAVPHLDSQRPVLGLPLYDIAAADARSSVYYAFSSGPALLNGKPLAQIGSNGTNFPGTDPNTQAVCGYEAPSYVVPTNEYFKDRQGKFITVGRQTYQSVKATLKGAAGVRGTVTCYGATTTPATLVVTYTGLTVNVADTRLSIPVGREVRDFTYSIASSVTMPWLPFAITEIEWTGHLFPRSQRV